MATKVVVLSVTLTLVNGTAVTIENTAPKAWGDFTHGKAVTDDDGIVYPYSAILSAERAVDTEEVDMTDTFCEGGGDFITLYLNGEEPIFITPDMLSCMEDGGYAAVVTVEAPFVEGHYVASLDGEIATDDSENGYAALDFGNKMVAVLGEGDSFLIGLVSNPPKTSCGDALAFAQTFAGMTITAQPR